MSLLDKYIDTYKICIFSKASCTYCIKAIELLKSKYIVDLQIIDIGTMQQGAPLSQELQQTTMQKTIPNIFIYGNHIGGYSDLKQLYENGKLLSMLNQNNKYRCEFCGKCNDTSELKCNCFPRQFSDWGEPK